MSKGTTTLVERRTPRPPTSQHSPCARAVAPPPRTRGSTKLFLTPEARRLYPFTASRFPCINSTTAPYSFFRVSCRSYARVM
jgi:hypothetical protein